MKTSYANIISHNIWPNLISFFLSFIFSFWQKISNTYIYNKTQHTQERMKERKKGSWSKMAIAIIIIIIVNDYDYSLCIYLY